VPEALIVGEARQNVAGEGVIIAGSIVHSGASGFQNGGSHGCIRLWTWRLSGAVNQYWRYFIPDWTREWMAHLACELFGVQHGLTSRSVNVSRTSNSSLAVLELGFLALSGSRVRRASLTFHATVRVGHSSRGWPSVSRLRLELHRLG